MKRISVIIVLLASFGLFLVSCSNDLTDSSNISVPDTVVKDLSSIGDEELSLTIGSSTDITFEGLSLEDGIILSFSSKSLEDAKAPGNEGLFRMQGGRFFPMPDGNRRVQFRGSEIGISGNDRIYIRKFENKDNDLKISGSEAKYRHMTTLSLAEEFYYIDFNSPEWSHLDRSRIVIVQTGAAGHTGFSIIKRGFKVDNDTVYGSFGLYDFSSDPGMGLYLFATSDFGNHPEFEFKLNVVNPVELEQGSTVSITKDLNVIYVPAGSGLYKVTLEFQNEASTIITRLATDYSLRSIDGRYLDGTNKDAVVVPYFYPDSKKVVYYLGSIDQPVMFNLNIDSSITGWDAGSNPATVVLEPASAGEFEDFYDLSGLNEEPRTIYVDSDSNGIVTIPFASTSTCDVKLVLPDNSIVTDGLMYSAESGGYGKGTGGVSSQTYSFRNLCTGYWVVKHNPVAEETELFTISNAELEDIECSHVVWNQERNVYVCNGDDGCGKEYGTFFLVQNRARIFDGSYVTNADSFVSANRVEYGRIMYKYGNRITTARFGSSLGSSTTGSTEVSMFGTMSYDKDDTDKMVEIRVKEIITTSTSRRLVCDIAVGKDAGRVLYEDVEMNYNHVHDWEVDRDKKTVSCSCGETHQAVSFRLEASVESNIEVIGRFRHGDKIIVTIPEFKPDREHSFEAEISATMTFDELPNDYTCYLFPNGNFDMEVEKLGEKNNFRITVSY